MILIDTNVLVFAHNLDSPNYKKANQLIRDALSLEFEACIAHQNFLEFYSVITNPKRVERPIFSSNALEWMKIYIESGKIVKLYPSNTTINIALALAEKFNFSKAEIFDCYLAAVMIENEVNEIYTENIEHFKKYESIKAINPFM